MTEGSVDRPRMLVVVHQDHAGPGRLGDFGAELDLRRPDRGDPLPADLAGYHGMLVLGGSMAAWEDDVAAWLAPTRRLLALAVEDEVPTLGICLGAQMLALATGGQVERGTAGLEVGYVEVELLDTAADDRLLGPVHARFGAKVGVPQWHQDAIVTVPPGAVRLATGDRYPNQAFRLGEAAWGLQYHPEVTVVDWQDWMDDWHGSVTHDGLDPVAVMARMAAAQPQLALLAQAHSEAFAQILLGARQPG